MYQKCGPTVKVSHAFSQIWTAAILKVPMMNIADFHTQNMVVGGGVKRSRSAKICKIILDIRVWTTNKKPLNW